ncbi:alcohol dehydrogenase catalytic domain-containing protein [Devosia sp. Leaf420]|uniref:alcohol dehydrogenase catalytic domain-containing protein n=1 Tax=Devosia sp. Leaf420 TaxID=1736374 RepID=UPI000B02EBAF
MKRTGKRLLKRCAQPKAPTNSPPIFRRLRRVQFDDWRLNRRYRIFHGGLKDAMALCGTSEGIRTFPLITGIDFTGNVETSSHSDFKPGDKVVVNGRRPSQTYHGGFAQKAKLSGDWLVTIPSHSRPFIQLPSAPPVTRRCSASSPSNMAGSHRTAGRSLSSAPMVALAPLRSLSVQPRL